MNRNACLLLIALAGLVLSGCGSRTIVVESASARSMELGEQETRQTEFTQQETGPERPACMTVYLCGAVECPGIYHLPAGARVYEVIAMAGGLREDADPETVNQAGSLEDGQMLKVLTRQEAQSAGTVYDAGTAFDWGTGAGNTLSQTSLVNINTATRDALMSLPGIGEAKADAIIAYRQEHGVFSVKEDIMQISGIKDSVYRKISDRICV